ncbi:DUF503 domain-containing protein [Sporosarcina aquimarina]|uniref:DUF503 domain-containing protein n=1 Tax=Sporosarcina aquimarina TaxID=114975 RepID=A0ABU4FYK7_9BACL|nr:DUF503 domain-containing protein [Sporosarcina aquimarina]MDW0109187.1 DUF503 domain-containing protein [Sporosarcina aquimarina]
MIVSAECSFIIPMAASLKDKRSVLKRMIDRVKNGYNVSIAELDHQDLWQRTTIGIVAISSSTDVAEREIRRVQKFLESNPEWELTEIQIDYPG